MTLSDASVIKILRSLECQEENSTIAKFRRGSAPINEVIEKNNKMKILLRFWKDFTVYAHGPEECIAQILFKTTGSGTYHANKRSIYLQVWKSVDAVATMNELLKNSKIEMFSIKILEFENLKINAKVLDVLKQHHSIIRGATSVTFMECNIELNAEEFLCFLKLFDNLNKLCCVGSFTEPCLTDEHLAMVKKSIFVNPTGSFDHYFHFPGISDRLPADRVKLGSSFNFPGMFSGLTYSSIWRTIEYLENTETSKTGQRATQFGSLTSSCHLYRQMAVSQRERNKNWKITKMLCGGKQITISSDCNSSYYEYRIYNNEHDFKSSLELMVQMQIETIATENVENQREKMQPQFNEIREQIRSYRTINRMIASPELEEAYEAMYHRFDTIGACNEARIRKHTMTGYRYDYQPKANAQNRAVRDEAIEERNDRPFNFRVEILRDLYLTELELRLILQHKEKKEAS